MGEQAQGISTSIYAFALMSMRTHPAKGGSQWHCYLQAAEKENCHWQRLRGSYGFQSK